VLTEVGPVPLDVPRDRDASFEPQLVKKRQRRLHGVDEMVISLTAKGLTTGEVQAHLAEVYDINVSRETVSKTTDAILGEMAEWLNRPLEQVYAAVFIDAIVAKIRDGQVTNRPAYTAIGVTADGTRDIVVCDGLKGLAARHRPNVCAASGAQHLPVGLTCRLGRDGAWPATHLHRPIEQAAKERLGEFNETWGTKYPAFPPAVGEHLDRVRPVPDLRP
jgi:putative transposase